jgi:hypothetical protein
MKQQYDDSNIGRIGGEFGRMLDKARALTVRTPKPTSKQAKAVDNFLKSIGYKGK